MRDFPEFPWKDLSFKNILLIIVFILVVIFLAESFYFVGPAESAIVKRFGKIIGVFGPGLHWKIPLLDSVSKVDVAAIRRLEIGFRTINI